MKLEHLAIWTNDIEKMKEFYIRFFGGKTGEKYFNEKRGFSSYFISFESGARLEIMGMNNIEFKDKEEFQKGYAHIAFSVGSKEKVDELTEIIRNEGYEIVSDPRTTGDGYYESCIKDLEGNLVEITI